MTNQMFKLHRLEAIYISCGWEISSMPLYCQCYSILPPILPPTYCTFHWILYLCKFAGDQACFTFWSSKTI